MNHELIIESLHPRRRALPGFRGSHRPLLIMAVLPLVVLTAAALAAGPWVEPWVWMTILAVAVYVGCKWLTWYGQPFGSRRLSLGYLLAWPGMDPKPFQTPAASPDDPPTPAVSWATVKIATGVALFALLAPRLSDHPLLAGWAGMIGAILILHFGVFDLLALAWQRAGVPVQPIMQRPLAAQSLGEFWGRRWNHGFNRLVHRFVFQPLHRRCGVPASMLAVFLVSGLIHELVISVPARGGYGGPTLYFLLQGLGVLIERTRPARRLGAGKGWRGWLVTMLFLALPLPILFHPPFVLDVVIPLMQAIGVDL